MRELFGELRAAAGKDGPLERTNAIETPEGIGDGLDKRGFAKAGGLVFVLELLDVVLIGGGIVGGKQDGAAGERCSDCVQRRFGFAFDRGRAGGELGVFLVSGELGFGDGVSGFGRCSGLRVGNLGSFTGQLLSFALGGAANRTGSHRFCGISRYNVACEGSKTYRGIEDRASK